MKFRDDYEEYLKWKGSKGGLGAELVIPIALILILSKILIIFITLTGLFIPLNSIRLLKKRPKRIWCRSTKFNFKLFYLSAIILITIQIMLTLKYGKYQSITPFKSLPFNWDMYYPLTQFSLFNWILDKSLLSIFTLKK
ncbi:hypothetical protein [Chroococcus sp. FPU101]|uniref:hypothetical protein n=1 Tax=Chroococcus sp. FPU101 TaxID=1974212 RepID=UPI001A8E3091|nr:hypothetical protein [Chroococcus sp. FPU101]GFE69107.1 hypothetical protein CFPU101_17170 [Chroococcus sp. FPU101]